MATSVPDFSSFLLPSAGGGGRSGGNFPNFGSNQYLSYPTPGGPGGGGYALPMSYNNLSGYTASGIPSEGYGGGYAGSPAYSYQQELPSGQYTTPTLAPGLTGAYANYLSSQIGQGLSPFNLQTYLPSTGTYTAPGQLSAPLTPVMQALQQYYTTGQWPGSTGGLPPGVAPMFQSELQAMQIPEQQQLADIREQFGARGALGSSEFANALAQFGEQTTAEQQALLGQLTMQALPQLQSYGTATQNLDQEAINRLYQQFYQIQPQYNPLLGAIGQLATTFPGISDPKQGIGSTILSGLGSLASTAGTLLPFTGL